jgi:prolyl oligopeptidase
MENLGDTSVRNWILAQGDYTRRVIDAIPGHAELAARVRELEFAAPARTSFPELRGGRAFYTKRRSGDDVSRLYVRDGLGGAERVLVDADVLHHAPPGRHYTINYCTPSPDGRFVSYGVALGGAEQQSTLYVIDVATGKLTGDSIPQLWNPVQSWMKDNSGFFFTQFRQLSNDPPGSKKLRRAFFHRLGTPSDSDRPVFGIGFAPGVALDSTSWPSVTVEPTSNYALAAVGYGNNGVGVYSAPVAEVMRGNPRWQKVADTADAVVDFGFHGDDLYIFTNRNAPRYKITRTRLSAPDVRHAADFVPASEMAIQSFVMARDAMYVAVTDGMIGRVLRVPYGGSSNPSRLALPFEGSALIVADPLSPGVIIGTASWARAWRHLYYDPSTRQLSQSPVQPVGPFDDPKDVVTEEVRVRAPDGTMVPLSIWHLRSLKRDGTAPTMLSGYGAYGYVLAPQFDPKQLAWIERGGIHAVCHVRGGGELGDEWYKAGMKATKPNTWNDFIACAEWLIKSRYTSSERLAGIGFSAGGIMIGRAITARPDLFRVAIMAAGDFDMVRTEFGPSGPANIPEFGTQKDSTELRGLYEMSAYHHVVDGVHYPAVLLTTGMNDPRVPPWQPAKMTARLQAASRSGRPVLLLVERDAGHMSNTTAQRIGYVADEYAFALWQFGLPLTIHKGGPP